MAIIQCEKYGRGSPEQLANSLIVSARQLMYVAAIYVYMSPTRRSMLGNPWESVPRWLDHGSIVTALRRCIRMRLIF